MGLYSRYTTREIEEIERGRGDYKRLKQVFANVKKDPTPKTILEAYLEHEKQGGRGFIGTLKELFNIEALALPNEYHGIEYEAKLDVQVSKAEGNDISPEDYLEKILSSLPPNYNFLSNQDIEKRSSENFYYGKDDEDSLVVMKNGSLSNLKYKENLEQLSFGLKNEEFVLKRKEKVDRGCSDEEVFKEIQRMILEGARYKGKIIRDRARTDLLSIKTGRVYLVLFDACNVFAEKKDSSVKYQIEAEYMGFIPNLSKKFIKGSEKQIAEDLLELTGSISEVFVNKTVDYCKIKSVNYTKERKFDFLK